MKQSRRTIILIIFFVAIIALSSFAYNQLTQHLPNGNNLQTNSDEIASNDDIYDEYINAKDLASDFTAIDSHENEVALFDFINANQPVVISFWTTWCPACVRKMPDLENAYQKYGSEVKFMAVNLTDGTRETKSGAMEFIQKEGYTFPVYFDTQQSAADAYEIRGIPVTYFIDRNGYITNIHLGSLGLESLLFEIELLIITP